MVVVRVVGAAQNLDVGFLQALECVDHCKEFCQVVNLFSFTRIAIQSNLRRNIRLVIEIRKLRESLAYYKNTELHLFH